MTKPTMFALIDCNNFFASCERLFRPDLAQRPVIVLSSNDGCVIARSNEAKAAGVAMGAPIFQLRDICRAHNITQFSANFALYGNISRRITDLLSQICPRTEAYSIDESFLDISQLPITDYTTWAEHIRSRILKEIGIPVSIGVAPTKTLAKLASEIAKTSDRNRGTLYINPQLAAYETHLAQTALKDVWGVGRKLTPKLQAEGISNALQLSRLSPRRAQQLMGIGGRRLTEELRGISCLPLETTGKPQQSIMRGRTFGEDTTEPHVIESAIASLGARAAYHLRTSKQTAKRASILIETNRNKPGYRTWQQTARFHTPTNDTGVIIAALYDRFGQIYSSGQMYHRLNVLLHDLSPESYLQTDLLGNTDIAQHTRAQRRMRAVDSINNRYGKGQIYFAAEDLSRAWQPKRKLQSPPYTTDWRAIPRAKIV